MFDETLNELIDRFEAPGPGQDKYDYAYYSELAIDIAKQGEAGIDVLLRFFPKANDAQLRAILFALPIYDTDRERLHRLLAQFLDDARPLIAAEAIDGLRYIGAGDVIDQVMDLLHHSSPYVRGSALRYMSRLYPWKAYDLLIKSLQDPDYIVRENAIDELQELDATDAIPMLAPLLHDPHPYVRQAAETALSGLRSRAGSESES